MSNFQPGKTKFKSAFPAQVDCLPCSARYLRAICLILNPVYRYRHCDQGSRTFFKTAFLYNSDRETVPATSALSFCLRVRWISISASFAVILPLLQTAFFYATESRHYKFVLIPQYASKTAPAVLFSRFT